MAARIAPSSAPSLVSAIAALERGVGELRGAAHVRELGRGFDQAQAGDQVRGVDRLGEAVERRVQPPAVSCGQTMGVVLDAEALAGKALLRQQRAQLHGRIGARAVDPDADVLDDRGVLGLAQIRRARQQDQIAVRPQHQALEEAVAEGVVAGEPVHALRLEHQQPVQPARRHRLQHLAPALVELFAGEVQSHDYLPGRSHKTVRTGAAKPLGARRRRRGR